MKTILTITLLSISSLVFSQTKTDTLTNKQKLSIILDAYDEADQYNMLQVMIYEHKVKKINPSLDFHDRETSNLIFKEIKKYLELYTIDHKVFEYKDFIKWALEKEFNL